MPGLRRWPLYGWKVDGAGFLGAALSVAFCGSVLLIPLFGFDRETEIMGHHPEKGVMLSGKKNDLNMKTLL